ncbi:gastrula zinc finger protein XlCGF58.1-like [Diorhabda carinulata]|uniref:gastrula zinc finger protein XlCGF58.1-like n=1 Tax=Diorhabda carinulata TaxID=1163345 RepID=UPI00259FE49F|nr:gastrula zinc finger protein XlCGF58.1-like [Diorhabda carinulata]
MNKKYCSICLESSPHTTRFNDSDENNIKWLTKLQSIVGDLQESIDEHLICNICTTQIDDFLRFKKKIEDLVDRLKYVEAKSIPYDDDKSSSPLDDFSDDVKDFDDNLSIKNEENNIVHTTEPLKDEPTDFPNAEGENFICLICDDEFTCKKSFKVHKKTCKGSPKGTYTCYTCNKTYTTKTNLKIHHKKCGKVNIESDKTDKNTKKKGRKSTRSYTCETCNNIFHLVKDLIAHCKTVHSVEAVCVKPYACNQCTQRFRTYAGYDQHLKYHSRNRDNVCSLCGKRFITKSELIVHEYTHFNRRNYICKICDKAYNTNKNLKTHNLVVHTDRSLWKYACAICGKRFPQKGNYDQHMKRHAGDKQHICHICQKPFITSSELKRHVNLHSNVKAFTCEYCQREYKTLRTLNAHVRRSHTIGEKPQEKEKKYVCHICPSQFYDKQKLSRHLYCHSGIKPFPCTACDKKFTDKCYMKHHMKVAHNIVDVSNEVKYRVEDDSKYEVPSHIKFEFEIK